ncbi:MAG: hypothetical protein M3373_04670 [Gemmatimonadota bacterium]|nr:hypothetical protein [Gemmatimonadota bacterium]
MRDAIEFHLEVCAPKASRFRRAALPPRTSRLLPNDVEILAARSRGTIWC